MRSFYWRVAALFVLQTATFVPVRGATDWTRLGGDGGMTRYSPDDIPGPVGLDYRKRFYSTFSNDPSNNYWYSQSLLIRNGTAAVFSSDTPVHVSGDNYGQGIPLTFFNFASGQTTSKTTTPSIAQWSNLPLPSGVTYTYPSGRYSLHLGENPAEIDSGHFTQAALWGDDGKIYVRHGSDNAVTASFNPQNNSWSRLVELKASPNVGFPYNNAFEGDANGFIQSYGSELLYRPGDTRQTSPYVAVDVSPAAYTSGMPGNFKFNIGPDLPAIAGDDFYNGLRYGDIPKVATALVNGQSTGVSIVSGLQANSSATSFSTTVQATNLSTGAKLWSKTFSTAGGGATGFYTSTADYWRFVASSDARTYVMFSDVGMRMLRGLDIATGTQKWQLPLAAGTQSPLLATSGTDLYVIGNTAQMKVNISTGKTEWSTAQSLAAEGTTYLSVEDPIYSPLVLTNDTEWFINGAGTTNQSLVGLRTSDGAVIQQIDLSSLVAKTAGESLLAVNDMAASDGKLALLLSIHSASDTNAASNQVTYQDVYVFQTTVPEPGTYTALTAAVLLRRRSTSRRPRSTGQ